LEFVIDKQGDSRDSLDELEKSFKQFDIGEYSIYSVLVATTLLFEYIAATCS